VSGRRVGMIAWAAVVAVTLGTALGPPAVARPGRPLPPPVVVAGNRVGPVDIHGGNTFGTIGTLHLPAGAWSVVAKALVVNTTGSIFTVHVTTCRLVAGSDRDRVQLAPLGGGVDSSEQVAVLNVVHRFAAAGLARLQCAADAATGDLQATFVRMSALRAGRVTVETIGGAASTTGSGIPRVISGRRAGPVAFTSSDGFKNIAEMPVPAGSWFISAKAYVQPASGSGGGGFTCDLVAGGDFDQTVGDVDPAGGVGDRMPAALTVVHTFATSGAVDLECQEASNPAQVRSIVITATKAGQLTNEALGGSGSTTGTGIPRIISGFDDGPTPVHGGTTPLSVGHMHVPTGAWLVVAKLSADNTSGTGPLHLLCRLAAGSDRDQVDLVVAPNGTVDSVQPLDLTLTHRFGGSGGTISVNCAWAGSTGEVQARFLKITAVKVGTLTTMALA
jgi:hypothetical protein